MHLLQRLSVIVVTAFATFPLHATDGQQTWLLTVDRWGNPEYQVMTLERTGNALAGKFGDWSLTGQQNGSRLRLAATDSRGDDYRFEGELTAERLQGHADYPDTNDPDARVRHEFHGRLLSDAPEDRHAPRVLEPARTRMNSPPIESRSW